MTRVEALRRSRASCSPRRAGTAPASSAPSRRSSSRSPTTGRRSTSASRSSTTRTSSATSRRAARSSSTTSRRCRRGRRSSTPRTGSRRPCTGAPPSCATTSIDATCPLVTKVHVQAQALRRRRLHGRPDRPRGSRGGRRDDGRGARVHRPRRVGRGRRPPRRSRRGRGSPTSRRRRCRSTRRARSSPRCGRRFPDIYAPKKEDICYATSNRQWAVKEMLEQIDLLLVIGSRNSLQLEPARGRLARERRRLVPHRRRDGHRPGVARRASAPSA